MRHDATERSRLFAAFAEGSVDGALRHAGASPATWSPVRLQQTLAAVSSAASKADEARLTFLSGLASIHLGTSLD